MITIPPRDSKKLVQTGRSKVLGNTWSSFNLDLQSELGLIRVSPRLRINTAAASNQGLMVAARYFSNRFFAICGTRIFKNSDSTLTTTFAEDASSGVSTTFDPLYSDLENFADTSSGYLIASLPTKLVKKVANAGGTGAWSDVTSGTLTSSDSVHKLCYFQKHNRLYVIDDYKSIKSMGTDVTLDSSGDYTLILNDWRMGGSIYTMATDTDNMWIGMMNTIPFASNEIMGGSSILRWDGFTAGAAFEYKIKAGGVLALCKDAGGIMHAMDTNGSLLKFNGSGFEEIDRLPIKKELLKYAVSGTYNSFIHPNGFILTRNGTFKVLVNNLVGDSGGTINENLPSGIWEWSQDKGFIHTNSASYTTLAASTVTDYAQNRVSAVGALYEPSSYSESSSGKSNLLAGIDYYTNASSTASGIFVDDPLNAIQKYGYFVTTWIESQNWKDTWKKVVARFRKFLDSGDKIVLKYRLTEAAPTEISITWVNTTSFTTTTNVSGMVGYEVEVIQGTGSGKCSHITAVSGSGTYTVTVDETYTGVTTGTAKARVQAWVKMSSVADQYSESAPFQIGKASERIQIKCCMQFTGDDELSELAIINEPNQLLV